MQPRTRRQREVLDYITSFIAERGYEPSYTQIARNLRIASKSAIAKHIAALESQGLLSRHRENGRFGLDVTPKASLWDAVYLIEWLEIPFADEENGELHNEPLVIPQMMLGTLPTDRAAAFQVRNAAMIQENICEGDIVILEKRSYARDGDMVVAFLENRKVLLKKYYRDGANIELRPANDDFSSITAAADEIEIQGVVRGLLRPAV